MRVNSVTLNNYNNYHNISFTQNNSPIRRVSQNDSFVSSTPKKTNFNGFNIFSKKETETRELTPAEKKSRDINNEINMIDLMVEKVKKDAKEESKNVEGLLNCGLVMQGQTYTTPIGKKYTIDEAYQAFTLYVPMYSTIDTETKVRKGAPIRCIERRKGQVDYKEVTYDFTKDGYKYTEKVKDYDGRKLRTEKKINMVRINGIGKSTYTERNEDGSFSTYVYKGSNKITTRFDIYNPEKGVWEKQGEDTMNLARKVS